MSEEILLTTFSQLRNRLMRLSRRFLRNEDDASDALQEAFCRLWPRRQTIRSPREAEALTVTTVRNVSINILRRQAAAPHRRAQRRTRRPRDERRRVGGTRGTVPRSRKPHLHAPHADPTPHPAAPRVRRRQLRHPRRRTLAQPGRRENATVEGAKNHP